MGSEIAEIWDECTEALDDDAGPVEQLESVGPMFRALAEQKVKNELDEATEEAWIEQIRQVVDITKSGVRSAYKQHVTEVEDEMRESQDSDYAPHLDHFIEDRLNEVVIHQTTDKHSDTSYHWRFDNGVMFSTTGGLHWSWSDFEDLLYDEMLVMTREPQHKDGREWKQWMQEIIDDRKRIEESYGPRTEAVNDIASYIGRTVAYPTAPQAAGWNGLWADEESEWVGVQSKKVGDYAEEHDVTVRGVQEELDARNYLYDNVEQVMLPNGDNVRFWKINKRIAEPQQYETDAGDPFKDEDE